MLLKIRKLAPGRLSRAIVALRAWTGNKRLQAEDGNAGQSEQSHCQADHGSGHVKFKRTTITFERERLLTIRTEQQSTSLTKLNNSKGESYVQSKNKSTSR